MCPDNHLLDRLRLSVMIGPIEIEEQDFNENQWFSFTKYNGSPYVKSMVFNEIPFLDFNRTYHHS